MARLKHTKEIKQLQEEIELVRLNNYITHEEFVTYQADPHSVIVTQRYGRMRIDHFFEDGFAAFPIRKDGQRFKEPAGSLKYFYAQARNPLNALTTRIESLLEDQPESERQYRAAYKERLRQRAHELLVAETAQNRGIVPRPPRRALQLSFELSWRTNKRSLNTVSWRLKRMAVLERDKYRQCVFCGFGSFEETQSLHVNHVDGNPENNSLWNLETVGIHCHLIIHSGFSSSISGVVEVYEHSDVSQEDIIRITRERHLQGYDDEYIKGQGGLRDEAGWSGSCLPFDKVSVCEIEAGLAMWRLQ